MNEELWNKFIIKIISNSRWNCNDSSSFSFSLFIFILVFFFASIAFKANRNTPFQFALNWPEAEMVTSKYRKKIFPMNNSCYIFLCYAAILWIAMCTLSLWLEFQIDDCNLVYLRTENSRNLLNIIFSCFFIQWKIYRDYNNINYLFWVKR